jgi:hypothetical protein
MRQPLFTVACLIGSQAWAQGLEEMHAAVGAVVPAGPTEARLETGWTFAIGGVYWFAPRLGLHAELAVHRFGLSTELQDAIGPAKDGLATIVVVPISGVWRLHDQGDGGFYLLAGPGIYNRQVALDEPSTAPLAQGEPWAGTRAGWTPRESLTTTRLGANAGLGWEHPLGRGSFFVEVRYHRMFTRGLPTEFVPVVVGSRF